MNKNKYSKYNSNTFEFKYIELTKLNQQYVHLLVSSIFFFT